MTLAALTVLAQILICANGVTQTVVNGAIQSACIVATAPVRDTSVVPDIARTVWAPGVRGIPARSAVCATLAPAEGDRSAALQTAVSSCPMGQIVQLAAGTYQINSMVTISRGITVRGAGPGTTRLVKTNGAIDNDYRAIASEPILLVGPHRWPKPTRSVTRLAADGAKGEMSVTVADATGYAAGQFVLLDADDYATPVWRPVTRTSTTAERIRGSDRLQYSIYDPPRPWSMTETSLTWFSRPYRSVNEIKEIASVVGRVVTFTTPLHIDYPVSKQAELARYDATHTTYAGIEDLGLEGGGNGAIRFHAAAYSWAKNVEVFRWIGEGIALEHSFRIEVRDSYIHDAVWPLPGGGGYAYSLAHGSSEALLENTTIVNANKMMVARSAGAGSVVAYNYADNGFIGNNAAWVEVGINASHLVGSHHILFEGNQSFNYDSDNTFGGSLAITVFRNWLTGKRRDFADTDRSARAAGLMSGSWHHVFLGNVLGQPGAMNGWIYEDTGTGTGTNRWSPSRAIWRLGYDPGAWDAAADPLVLSTVTRRNNFDYLTNTVRDPLTLPASLYLDAKPSFMGERPWPWVTPDSMAKTGTLPAAERAVHAPIYRGQQ